MTYAAANHVWPNSTSLYNYIAGNKFTSVKKLNIIGKGSTNGIDINRFNKNVLQQNQIDEVKQSIGYSQEFIYLLCIGRIVLDKGIAELVNVFVSLQKNIVTLN
ncbi:MAG: hypothetical protein WDM90_17055 [Ferruginibacter sp.]